MNPVLDQILTAAFGALPWGIVFAVIAILARKKGPRVPPRLK